MFLDCVGSWLKAKVRVDENVNLKLIVCRLLLLNRCHHVTVFHRGGNGSSALSVARVQRVTLVQQSASPGEQLKLDTEGLQINKIKKYIIKGIGKFRLNTKLGEEEIKILSEAQLLHLETIYLAGLRLDRLSTDYIIPTTAKKVHSKQRTSRIKSFRVLCALNAPSKGTIPKKSSTFKLWCHLTWC